MDDDSKHKTAIVCHMGQFQFRRMPKCPCNIPMTDKSVVFREGMGACLCISG